MTQRVDKDSLPLDRPRRTPNHPTKSHIVKTKVNGKEKIIRFGEQGASTAGKPKAGESDRMKMKRKSFKARHAKNIAKGKSSPAYWADKVKWNTGGSVELSNMLADYESADDVRNLVQKFDRGGQAKKNKEPDLTDYLLSAVKTLTSLPEAPKAIYEMGKRAVQATPDVVRSGVRYVQQNSPRQVARDVRGGLNAVARAVRNDPVGTAVDFIPVVGDIKAYGEDVARAAQLRAQGDVAGAQQIERLALPLAIASIAPGVGEARKAAKVADVVDTAVDTARAGTRTMKRAASFPVDYGRPKGNLNLRPNIDPVTLKGAEVQDIDSLINQLRGRPGVTKEGLEQVARQFEPGERVSLAQFGERLPQSEYNMIDLLDAADNADEHLRSEAIRWVNEDSREVYGELAEVLGLDYSKGSELEDIVRGGTSLADEDVVDYLRDTFGAKTGREIKDMLTERFHEVHENAIERTMEDLRDQAGFDDFGGYAYRDYQRLVPLEEQSLPGYFEMGVEHPSIQDLDYESVDYRGGHYPNTPYLAGHVRGTMNPSQLLTGRASPRDASRVVGEEVYGFTPKPNSMVIEELQSDVAKKFGTEGALHQIHGTLFKGALQKALEQGADTVYLPTSKVIGATRNIDPSKYAPIYDKEVVKYGLNPLREIPGVEINPIEDMYHEITVTPEARERILKGVGQKAPGYAEGGLVSSYDEAKVADLADQIREGIYG